MIIFSQEYDCCWSLVVFSLMHSQYLDKSQFQVDDKLALCSQLHKTSQDPVSSDIFVLKLILAFSSWLIISCGGVRKFHTSNSPSLQPPAYASFNDALRPT